MKDENNLRYATFGQEGRGVLCEQEMQAYQE
jgi:hypothetical protein